MSGGLLMGGVVVPVEGVTVIGPHETAWAHLDPGDCRPRREPWIRQVMLHRTVGDPPDRVLPGAGPSGGDERTARYWQGDPAHSAAQLVIAADGRVACLADLVLTEAYDATVSNPYSIGIEMHEEPGGVLYEAQLAACVAVVKTICEHVGIQFQVPRGYSGHPLKRMLNGGINCVGVFGHRHNTEQRGRWDPGDAIFARLIAAGAEPYDFDVAEDVVAWKARQRMLVARGHELAVDGIPGPATAAALKAEGWRGGVFALGAA